MLVSESVQKDFIKIALAKPNWWYALTPKQQLDYLHEHKRSKLHHEYFSPVSQISLTKEEVKELQRVSNWFPRINKDGTCDIGSSTPNDMRLELIELVNKKIQKSLTSPSLKTKIQKLYNYYSKLDYHNKLEKIRKEELSARVNAEADSAKIISLTAINLKKLPFIKSVQTDTNFYNDPRVQASATKVASGLDTQITVSAGANYLQFDSISVSDADRGKGYSVKMIKAVLDAIDKISLDKPIYLSDPYNEEFWNHIRNKFILFNWRFY
jgi:predicted GNAT family acetyltransferase